MKTKMTLTILFSIWLSVGVYFLASCKTPSESKTTSKLKPTYKIGYMICNSPKETDERFKVLTAYMGNKLGVNFEMETIDTTQFMKELDKLHFTHTNSLLYIMMNEFHGAEILATEKKGSLGIRSQGVIIVRKDSGIEKIEDLKGKSMIFGPTLAPTGFMSQIDLLQQHGIDPENDLAFYTIPHGSASHEKVMYGVMFGKYDAGALPMDDVERMANDGRIDKNDYKIIAKNKPIPYCNFAATQKADENLAKKFKDVLLSIKEDTIFEYKGEKVKIFPLAWVDGYEDAKDSDFDIVRKMAKRTNMPPYQKF